MIDDKILKGAFDEIIMLRREFHQKPEKGWMEYCTTAKIIEYLKELGFEVKYGRDIICENSRSGLPEKEEFEAAFKNALASGVDRNILESIRDGFTGVVGKLDSGCPGKTTAFRFDIDAMPGEEICSSNHKPFEDGFSSMNSGTMHSCGHDGHAALGLVLARCVKKMKDDGILNGKVIFIFQPAEEGVRGAKSVVDSGILDDADYFFSGHIGLKSKRTGEIICGARGFLSTIKLDCSFKGVSAHAGSCPEKGRNALLAASTAAIGVHTLAQHGAGTSRINVGMLNAGTSRNTIPDRAKLCMEIRGENDEITQDIFKRVKEIINGSAAMYGVQSSIEIVGQAPSGKSDSKLINIIKDACKNIEEIDSIIDEANFGASEDVTFMMNRVQANGGNACYTIVGSNLAGEHHTEKFDFDERSLGIWLRMNMEIISIINKVGEII